MIEYLASAALVVLSGWWLVGRATRPVASPILVIAPFLYAGWVGAVSLGANGLPYGTALMWVDTCFLLMLGASYAAMPRPRPTAAPSGGLFSGPQVPRALTIVTGLLVLITLYHFSVVGVPVLSDNPELARWNFTGSGFYGIPGRVYNYGLICLYVLIAAVRSSDANRGSVQRSLARLQLGLGAFIVMTRVLGGFKGELLSYLVIVLACELVQHGGRTLRALVRDRRLVSWAVIGLLLAFGYAYALGSRYQSTTFFEETSGISWPERFADRLTGTGAEPGRIAVEARSQNDALLPSAAVVNDVRYYASRYVPGIKYDGTDFNTVLSARMSGRVVSKSDAPNSQDFIVPVTPGLPAFAFYDLGIAGVIAAGLVCGALLGLAGSLAESRLVARAFIGLIVLFSLKDIVLKGNPVYQIFNWPLVAAATYGLVVAFLWWLRDPTSPETPPEVPDVAEPLADAAGDRGQR